MLDADDICIHQEHMWAQIKFMHDNPSFAIIGKCDQFFRQRQDSAIRDNHVKYGATFCLETIIFNLRSWYSGLDNGV